MSETLGAATQANFVAWMKETPDPRVEKMVTHPLPELLFVLFIGQMCGMEDVDEIVLFARMHMEWFRTIMEFKEGIASAQTFRRVLGLIDHKAFERLFTAWAAQWCAPGVVAIDGKCLRGASEKGAGEHKGLYTVNAFSSRTGLVLGQSRVHDKSNEITAIPALLEQLTLKGNIVTIDAMGTQSKIAEAIRAKEADYILALKGNQSSLRDDVDCFFEDEGLSKTCARHATTNLGHGRIEERIIRVTDAIGWLKDLHPQWKDLRTIIAVTSIRTDKKSTKSSTETRYYISSLPPDPEPLLQSIRSHGSIENTLHWSLDVVFGEDASRLRQGNAAANMAVIRKIAFNALKREPSDVPIKLKRLQAAHDPAFRSTLINRPLPKHINGRLTRE